MTELLFHYLRAGLFGSIIIGLILALRYFLIKAPRKFLCLMWLLAAIRLLLPFQLEHPLSFQPRYNIPQAVVEQPAQPQWIPATPSTGDIGEVLPEVTVLPMPVTPPTAPQTVSSASIDITQVFAFLWLGITIAMVLYSLISYGMLRYKLRDAVRYEGNIWESDRVCGGFLLGYFRPRIYIPVSLSPHERQLIVAHERCHAKRGDNWWKLAGYLCCCIHWYNPLVWAAYVLASRDIEIACDEKVITTMDLADRKAYSMALLNCGKRKAGFFACPVAFGEVSLKQRIKNVLQFRRAHPLMVVSALCLAVFVAVCFLTSPLTPTTDPLPTQTASISTPTAVSTETIPATTVPTTVPVETTPAATVPTTVPVETAPATTVPTTVPVETTPSATVPPESTPAVTEPTAPATTPTEPPVTNPQDDHIVAQGKWDYGPFTWKITADGTLTIEGFRQFRGKDHYIWKDYKDIITQIVVSDGITTIPQYAFSDMPNLTSLYLSNTLEVIEENAFSNCTALQSVTFPASLTEIKDNAFSGCISVSSLNFPQNCKIHTIRPGAFNCTAITSFIWPESLRNMDFSALFGCTRLQYYQSHWETFTRSPLYSGNDVFLDGGIETAAFHGSSVFAMTGEKYLTTVVFDCILDSIPSSMFADCTSLSSISITFPITRIDSAAFYGCTALTGFTIPDSVTTIRSSAFAHTGITCITIPPSVQHIDASIFDHSAVSQITFQGNAPQYIHEDAFSGITATVYYPAGNSTWTADKLQDYGGNITWIPQ